MPSSSSTTAQCPECGAKFRLKEEAAGKKVKCKSCEAVFVPSAAGGNGKKSKAEPAEDSGGHDFDDLNAGRLQALPPRRTPHPTKKKVAEKPEAVPDDELEKVRKKALGKGKTKEGISPALIGAAAAVALGLVVVVVLLIRGGGGPSMEPITAYTAFQDDVAQAFSVEYPAGWQKESGGNTGSVIWAKFEKGNAQIRLRTSMGGSALGDMAKATANPNEKDESQTPVAKVHEFLRDQFAQDYGDYQEASTFTLKSKRGDARVSEFSAKEGWSSIKGFRATLLGGPYQITLIAKCSPAEWDICQPAFRHVIESVGN